MRLNLKVPKTGVRPHTPDSENGGQTPISRTDFSKTGVRPPFSLSHTQPGTTAIALALLITLTGCFSNDLSSQREKFRTSSTSGSSGSTTSGSGLDSGTTTSPSVTKFFISNVITSTTGSSPSASLFFDSTRATPAGSQISAHCATAAPKTCVCKYSWQEVNTTTTSSIPIPRSVQTNISSVQSSLVVCALPAVFNTEIPTGTSIQVSVVTSGSNPDSGKFEVPPKAFTKSGTSVTGSFQDAQGRSFDNILRYACYEQFSRGMQIINKKTRVTNPDTGEVKDVVLASQFCVANASGASAGQGCEALQPSDFSAQAYYYNFYIRNSDAGGINSSNAQFTCPLVKEALNSDGSVGTSGKFWPMDQSFALALDRTNDFTVGVEAFTRIRGGASDPSSNDASCGSASGSSNGGGSSNNAGNRTLGCLGFAKKPNIDSTCSPIQDASGRYINTYRLRRFVSLLPPRFDTDGQPIAEPQPVDTIYVLDRPVTSLSADPLRPFTMRGPKPCPYSFFDHKGVTSDVVGGDPDYPATAAKPGGMPGYVATNNPLWNNTNVDGIQFPNRDQHENSCAMPLIIPNTAKTRYSIGTLHPSNPAFPRMYVRPIESWAPHYEEDLSFQACAPLAQPLVDPPIHISRDSSTGNVSWCAEAYPTQNQFVGFLDVPDASTNVYPGKVINFTSHVVKNSVSQPCTATQLSVASSMGSMRPEQIPPTSNYPISAATSGIAGTTGCFTTAGAATTHYATSLYSSVVGAAYHPSNLVVDETTKAAAAACTKAGTAGATGALPSPATKCYYCSHQTCDRTVINPTATWPRFPLLSRPSKVEEAIAGDSTYSCMITFDEGGAKTGKSTPTGGCCGTATSVKTGLTSSSGPATAHLEPGATQSACLTPDY